MKKVVLLRKLSSCDYRVGPIINLSKTHRTLYRNSPQGAQNINYQYDVNSTQKKKNNQQGTGVQREFKNNIKKNKGITSKKKNIIKNEKTN